MSGRTKPVTVRLDPDELQQLRKLPGDSDAARLRTLLHTTGATDGLAAKIAGTIQKSMAQDHQETQRLVKAIGPILQDVYKKLSEQIQRRPS